MVINPDNVGAMREALREAQLAPLHGDVPIGAVLIKDGEIIARAHNRREVDHDPTAHAEVLVLRQAASLLHTSRLDGTTLVVTLEPCAMCAGAMLLARVSTGIFGADDPKAGAFGSLYNLGVDPRLNHSVNVQPGVLASEGAELLTSFFAARRG